MINALSSCRELGLTPSYAGKVRDLFDLGDRLLIVATDRVSAYDVVMPQPVPGKGILLTRMSIEWFRLLEPISRHHLITDDWRFYPAPYRHEELAGRSMLVRKTRRLDLECVVRGYLVGSGWKDYQADGAVCGIALPRGLVEASRLQPPLFTPATKAAEGHDLNVSHAEAARIVGEDWLRRLMTTSLDLYRAAERYARERGVIIADTKLEFGELDGELILIDEAFTPDSSRFWSAADYKPGKTPDSFDKQILRRHLDQTGWNREPPPPDLPPALLEQLRARYAEILGILFPAAEAAP
jgi:phosphoribosylaminoimidazole-succinocarboxamide synthase